MEIIRANQGHLDAVAELFDRYRQFYQQPADAALARTFIAARMAAEESVIFLARDGEEALGFVQLYPTFCSVDAGPIWVLYDLFVAEQARQRGVGAALMQAAREMAEASGALRMDLSTATDNHTAQRLYEALGWERDTGFYVYSLELD